MSAKVERLTPAQVAEQLERSTSFVYKEIREGRLHPDILNGHVRGMRIKQEEVDRYQIEEYHPYS